MADFSEILNRLGKEYQVDLEKRFFPLNSMRLYYLLLSDGLTNGNAEVLDKVNRVIPKIAQLLDVREGFLREKGQSSPKDEQEACKAAIGSILEIVNTPVVQHTFDLLFSGLYPLQEELLLSMVNHLKEPSLKTTDLFAMLKIRAMDSVIYSTLIKELVSPKGVSETFDVEGMHWHVNLMMQLNDLMDGICYAKQDLEAGSATLVEIIRKIVTDPEALEGTMQEIFESFSTRLKELPLPEKAQAYSVEYSELLKVVVYGRKN